MELSSFRVCLRIIVRASETWIHDTAESRVSKSQVSESSAAVPPLKSVVGLEARKPREFLELRVLRTYVVAASNARPGRFLQEEVR